MSLRLASTLILCKPRSTAPVLSDYRVLYVRRSLKASFMPGAHVFPGGVVEEVDRSQEWLSLIPGASQYTDLPLRLAGIREAFEESSVLLADGETPSEDVAQRWRSECQTDSSRFLAFCKAESLVPQVSGLHRWAHWITPKAERKRFDTHFYVALTEPGTEATVDDAETIRSDWASPAESLALFEDQKISFPPPTWFETRRMAEHRTVAGLLAAATAQESQIKVLMPQLMPPTEDGKLMFAMPGDELYTENGEANPKGSLHRVIMGTNPIRFQLIKRQGKL